MLERPLVLIVGAGASFDFGFPVGDTLAKNIRGDLSFEFDINQTAGSRSIIQAAQAATLDMQKFCASAWVIADALPHFKSIDDCLHTHAENELAVLAGKMAIADRIAQAEIGSNVAGLWQPDRNAVALARQHATERWVGALVRMLVAGRARGDYAKVFDGLTIISFNYDRCLEAIIFHLIQPALNIGAAEAAEAMAGLTVLHPYGSLGRLKLEGGPGVPYAPRQLDLMAAAQKLFVYTEAREASDELQAIKDAVYSAERLLFLGFGFHRQNIELLADKERELRGKEMFGTVLNEPPTVVSQAQRRLGELIGVTGPYTVANRDCSKFLAQFGALLGG